MGLDRNRSCINCVDISKEYTKVRRTSLSHRQLIQKLVEYYKGDFITLSSRGIAAILAFKSDAANFTYMVPEETDDVDKAFDNVEKKFLKR